METDIENDKEYIILIATSKRIRQLCDAPKTERERAENILCMQDFLHNELLNDWEKRSRGFVSFSRQ